VSALSKQLKRLSGSLFIQRVCPTALCSVVIVLSLAGCAREHAPFTLKTIEKKYGILDPWMKDVADVNGDGVADIFVAGRAGPIVVYRSPDFTRTIVADSVAVPGSTTGMRAADLDRDGDVDVLLANGQWFENVSVSDSFAWRPRRFTRCYGHDVFTGDLDRDGDNDIVVRHQFAQGDTIRVFEQHDTLQWREYRTLVDTGEGLALIDLDRDGYLDLVTGGTILLGNGGVAVDRWERETFAAWHADALVMIADMDNDGWDDIVLSRTEGPYRFSWFKNPGGAPTPNEGWEEVVIDTLVNYVHGVVVADFTGDGRPDIAAAEMQQSEDRRVFFYENRGGSTRWERTTLYTKGSHILRGGDFDGDGDIDFFGANWNSKAQDGSPVLMWENTRLRADSRPGSLDRWARRVVDRSMDYRALFIDARDCTGDGLPDIVAGNNLYKNPGRPKGSWKREVVPGGFGQFACMVDVNGDAAVDLIGTAGRDIDSNGTILLSVNDGAGRFSTGVPIAVLPGDFLQGVAVLENGSPVGVLFSWHHPGHGIRYIRPAGSIDALWEVVTVSERSQDEALSVADLDGDGDEDFVTGTWWFENRGNGFSRHTIHETGALPDRNRVADINGDGQLDVVVGYEAISVPGLLAWYTPVDSCRGRWRQQVIDTIVGPMSVDVGDMDGDGDIDVVAGEHNLERPATATAFVFENKDGMGVTWRRHVVYRGDEHHDGMRIVDIDNDGDKDIVSIGLSHRRVVLYENRALVRQ